MLSVLKPTIEKTLTPLAAPLRNVNPNLITLLGIIFPVLFYFFIIHGHYVLALIALALSATDMLDGLVARAQNKVTAFGGFLDSTVDRFADFVVLVAFGFSGLVSWKVDLTLVLLSYLISYIRSRTELAAKGNLVASVGIMERPERLIALFIGLALYTAWPNITLHGLNFAGITFVILIVLSLVTVGQRVVFAYKNLA
jgi:archaetidylinositol phosphate synthase